MLFDPHSSSRSFFLALLTTLALSIVWSIVPRARAAEKLPHLRHKGMAVHIDTGTSDEEIRIHMSSVKGLGSNAVLLKVSEFQPDRKANIIFPDPEVTLSGNKLRFSIQTAHRHHMRVLLMLTELLH